ncbi:MAG: hypothetical protein QOD03_865 [Verrucomicrobiota bacterium]|jgi:hypothetical protein
MKSLAGLVLIPFISLSLVSAEGQPTEIGKAIKNALSSSSSLSATQTSPGVRLNGIFVVPPIRKALVEIGIPGQEGIRCALAEGERAVGVELLAIHESKGTVTVRYDGSTNELMLLAAPNHGTNFNVEAEKDVSHLEYHKMRARLDRERDALENANAQINSSKTAQ